MPVTDFANSLPLSGLYGLVACGGKSSRMGMDKSLLNYFGKPQCYYVYEMLARCCEKVFISCNEQQADGIDKRYETLPDLDYYAAAGPMSALLTAFTGLPHKSFLMIGCDYPFMDNNALIDFLALCNGDTPAAFFNEAEGLYEPVLAYYPQHVKRRMLEIFEAGNYSLQHFLREEQAIRFYPADKRVIKSVDTFARFKEASQSLSKDLLR